VALRKFARQTGSRYRLHTIYGENIIQTGEFLLDQYFHINFMAWPKGKQNKSQTPVHFFAEAHNPSQRNRYEEKITLCCMLVNAQRSPSHVGMFFFYLKLLFTISLLKLSATC